MCYNRPQDVTCEQERGTEGRPSTGASLVEIYDKDERAFGAYELLDTTETDAKGFFESAEIDNADPDGPTAQLEGTQDIFIKIFTHIHKLDNDEAFIGWAYRIAVNTCLSYLRSHKNIQGKMVPFDVVEGVAQSKAAPDHERMFDRIMEEALQDLSTKLRSVFVLHDIQGFKHEEVAQILGCSAGTSKSQLFKARMKIRQRLQKKRLV